MTVNDIMPAEDWTLTRQIAGIYSVPPEILAAIGWHETHWGRLGAGRRGWYLGYGYFPGSTVAEQYRGLLPQLQATARKISNYFRTRPLNASTWRDFAFESWRPGDPAAWAASTWRIYEELQGKPVEQTPSPALPSTPGNNLPVVGQISSTAVVGGAVILMLAVMAGMVLFAVKGRG